MHIYGKKVSTNFVHWKTTTICCDSLVSLATILTLIPWGKDCQFLILYHNLAAVAVTLRPETQIHDTVMSLTANCLHNSKNTIHKQYIVYI